MNHNNCRKCDKKFVPKKGTINYCSLSCRNSRNFSDQTKEKKSSITKRKWLDGSYSLVDWENVNSDVNKRGKQLDSWKKKSYDRLFNGEKLHIQTLRKLLIGDVGNCCELCNTSEWLGSPITLEVHHIDGNNKNNELPNLQILCPNCHSQTDNYRAKNIKKKTCNQLESTL
jgi:5-methylcytosine-specific restriction endonuclease McrA